MNAPVEVRRDDLRQQAARDLMRHAGHENHPHELEVIHNELETGQHDRLVIVWCVAESCKRGSPRGTAVGPTRVCLLTRCTLCHPVTWWERFVSTIKVAFG